MPRPNASKNSWLIELIEFPFLKNKFVIVGPLGAADKTRITAALWPARKQ
jgi:hypothetical protein